MKPRALFINASRGMVVDDDALREHILSGHIAGAALDVFPVEPKAQGDPFESRAARPRQRHPHPARRRLDPGGAGGDRLLRRRQARSASSHERRHRAVGQPARGRARPPPTGALRIGLPAPQRARRARRGQPAARRRRRQRRRPVPVHPRRARLRRHRHRRPADQDADQLRAMPHTLRMRHHLRLSRTLGRAGTMDA